MALCGTAGIWTASRVVPGHRGQTPNDAAGVRTRIENNVFEFERHGAALRIRCATPFKRASAYGTERLLSVILLSSSSSREREREQPRVPAVHTTYITVLLYERYYRLKNAMAPRVFLSFSIAILS